MKGIFIRSIFTACIMATGLSSLQAAEKFMIDPKHSYVLWHISHLGFSTQTGKWYVKQGWVMLDKEQPQNSKVEASIDVANIITGLPELDKHLKGEQFFDVERYPTATFISNKVELLSPSRAKVHGMLTLHGESKPVTLMVSLNKEGISLVSSRMTAGFSATTSIKRSDFGMNTLLPALGDDVALEINAEAYK
jgi:polyisoprenoid-binding protein YceI